MDNVVAAEATAAEREASPKLHETINEPLNLEEVPKVRTKLHLYTTLIALYASNTI
jgi:hypothetical protein